MNPSQLRQKILTEHATLRAKLGDVKSLVARVRRGEPGSEPQLRQLTLELVKAFRAHIAMEDEELVPTLRDIDAWGQIRAERVERDHEWHREALDKLEGSARSDGGADLLRGLESLMQSFLDDMQTEDETVLHPNLLRDDPISIDQSAS